MAKFREREERGGEKINVKLKKERKRARLVVLCGGG
jgi:hypothetical protein